MRFYKLNGVWQSWDYLHNELGYAEHETRPTVFKSCADATWGENAGNGYYDGDVNDMINGTFWTDADPTGWFDLDGLVWNSETYPADAAPSLLVKDGVASDALVITCDDGNYYLIRAIIDTTAWIPESEVEALGWRSPSFVVVDSTTGKVVSGCNQELDVYELPSVVLNSEDGYDTYELPAISLAVPKTVIGVPITGPVQAFWFTDNGRDETSDKMFTVVGNPLFNEDGSVARNELYELAVPLSFMQHDGNMFEADSDTDTVRYLPTTERLTLSIPGDSTTRGKSAWSVQVAKLFVLSYANTQLPDVQIELPINEVGAYGTSITLPTIDGEYESGGKTWKPSAWDIGAFGDSYTLNADTVAHLIFEEVLQQFVVSFANTTYPQFDVDLPEQAVVIAGESITLPSVSGQFVEDGYVYTPSGWDIGDFGSEFTPACNTIANLIFNAEKQYEEIKLYLPSGDKKAQKQVTSGFTGNVNATYCYQLYTDERLTTPWTGYDYSNTYEFGAWRDGVWVPTATQKISDLPDTYTSDSTQWKMALILMDNGFLWLASNVSGSSYMAYPSGFITVHIYPKGETVFAMYPVKTSSMGIYDNKSISTSGQNMQWIRGTAGTTEGGVNFPTMLVNGVYKSGAIFDQSLVSRATVWSSGGNSSTIRASSTSSFSCNAITFTFEQPIYKAWFKSDHTNLAQISAGTNRNLFDENGNNLMFEDDCTYTPCLVFSADGNGNGNMHVNASQLIVNNSSYLAYKLTNGTLQHVAYVLYTKKYGIDIDVNFGDPVTIPEGYRVESVKCSKLFVKASNVTGDDTTREINFEYLGENLFCTDKNKTWFGAKVSPVIEMFGF